MPKKASVTKIHINQHVIKKNKKTGNRDPVITVKKSKSNRYGREVIIRDVNGNLIASVVYRPDKPMSCGATVWIEVPSDKGLVEVIN